LLARDYLVRHDGRFLLEQGQHRRGAVVLQTDVAHEALLLQAHELVHRVEIVPVPVLLPGDRMQFKQNLQ
jgi:hypothetical protein